MGIKGVSQLLLPMTLLLAATPALAAEIHGRSSTQLSWFNNELTDNRRQVELGEYLRVGITNIDKDGKFSVFGYGRATQDLINGEGFNTRLFYLYGEYRDLFEKADLKFGRQFVNNTAGSAVIDGVQLDLKKVGPVGFSLFTGRDVVFGLNGELGSGWNNDFGLSAYLTGFKQTDAEVAWFRKWDKSDIARDILGMSAKQYLMNNLKLYGNAKYDTTAEEFNEVMAGVKYFPTSDLIFTGEYFQSYATFDATSIYSVFAVNQYQEGVFRADYTINDKLSANFGYNRQGYGEGAAANVYHIGVGVRPIEHLKLNVEYDNRNGYYGSTNGTIIDVDYELNKQTQLGAGFTYDVYQRDALTSEEIARRYWLGGKYKVAKNMAVSGRIQADVNAQFSHNTSGRLTFDYDF